MIAPSIQPVLGTDGKAHVVYEIRLANTRAVPATLQRVAVVDPLERGRVQVTFEGAGLQGRLRSLSNRPTGAMLELDDVRQVLVDLSFEDPAAIPANLTHRLNLLGASVHDTSPVPVQQSCDAAPLMLDERAPLVIGAPLAGTDWVAYDGCCAASGAHATGLPVNGEVHFAQRFAIDWIRMDARGHSVNGYVSDVRNYPRTAPMSWPWLTPPWSMCWTRSTTDPAGSARPVQHHAAEACGQVVAVVYTMGIYHLSLEADDGRNRHRKAVQAWPQPSGSPA